MAADDDVLNFQILDGILNDGQGVDVGVDEDVGDVAVAEDLTGLQAQDGRLGTSRVRAAYPENLRGLALSE